MATGIVIIIIIIIIIIPGEVGQPGRHVLEAEMLHLNVGCSEALDALLQELQREVWLVGRQSLTHALDEDRVIRRNAQTYQTQHHSTDHQTDVTPAILSHNFVVRLDRATMSLRAIVQLHAAALSHKQTKPT